MYSDTIIKALEKFTIYYENKEITFSSIEKKLIDFFYKEEKDNIIYIMPSDNVYLLVLFIIYSGLKQYLENIYSVGNDLIDEIKAGDILEYSKARCKFLGIENGKMKIRFGDGLLYSLPIEQRYKVSLYKGNANTLNKFPKHSNRGAKKTNSIICQILDIDNDAFSKIINTSTLLVVQKDIVFSLVEKVKIKFNDELLDLGQVFPMAYCSSEDNYYYFKGNSAKQEPIIKFISKIYNAKDIIKKDKKINSVVVLQKILNNEDIEDLVYISERKNILKMSIFMNPLDIERQIHDNYIKEDFSIINVSGAFFGNIDVNNINQFNKSEYRLIKNYIQDKENYITIQDDNSDKYRKKILENCTSLLRALGDDNQVLKFVINARTIAKRLACMILPLPEHEKFFEKANLDQYTIKVRIQELENFYNNDFLSSLSNDIRNIISEIYKTSLEYYEKIMKNNSKWKEIEKVIKFSYNEKICIIVENKNIRRAFRNYLKSRGLFKNNLFIESINTFKDQVYEKVIYSSKLDDNYYWNYKSLNSNKNIYILSKYEKNNLKYLKRRYFKFIGDLSGSETPENRGDIFLDQQDERDEIRYDKEFEIIENDKLNNELEKLIATNYIPIHQEYSYNQSLTTCEFVLIFTSGEKAFITPQYESYILNESKEELMNKKPKNLQKGDIILFVESIAKDLIHEIVLDLMYIDEIRNRYNNDYELVNQWKSELDLYMKSHKITYRELEDRLRNNGTSRCGATIRSWLKNAVVGPQEEEVLKVLGEITGIDLLFNRYKECFYACNSIRKFQLRVRKAIARCILMASISDENGENDELDILIRNRITETMKYIKKVEIENIYEIRKEIPTYLTNRVIEE